MGSIIAQLLPFIIKIVAYFIDKSQLSTIQKKAFLDFVNSMSTNENSSKKHRDSFKELHTKLKQRIEK